MSVFCVYCQRYCGESLYCLACGRVQSAPFWAEEMGVPSGVAWVQVWQGRFWVGDQLGQVGSAVVQEDERWGWRVVGSADLALRWAECSAETMYLIGKKGVAVLDGGQKVAERVRVEGPLRGASVDRKGRIWAVSADGSLYCWDSTGKRQYEIWHNPQGHPIITPPHPYKGEHVAVVTSHNRGSHLYRLRLQNQRVSHEEMWRGKHRVEKMIGLQDRVILITQKEMIAFDLGKREEVWCKPVSCQENVSPVVAEGVIYFVEEGGRVQARGLADGELVWEQVRESAETVRGLALWHQLLLISESDGVTRLEAATGERVAGWEKTPLAGKVRGAPILTENGKMAVACQDRVQFLWWHGGNYAHGAQWLEKQKAWDLAASCWALAGEDEKAAACWARCHEERLSAELYRYHGKFEQAASWSKRAGERWRGRKPADASAYFLASAELYRQANKEEEAAECRQLAEQAGALPYLTVTLFNLPDIEVGKSGTVAFQVENKGLGQAYEVAIELGGAFLKVPTGVLDRPISPNEQLRWDVEDLIPTREGEQMMPVVWHYQDEKATWYHKKAEFPLIVKPGPDIEVSGSVGAMIFSAEHPLPRVRINGDLGLWKIT